MLAFTPPILLLPAAWASARGFDDAFRRTRPALLEQALRLTGDYTQAFRLVTETQHHAFTERHRLGAGRSFRAWCFAILESAYARSAVRGRNRDSLEEA